MSNIKFIVLAVFIGLIGCEPEEGPEGPQGIQGEQGEPGPRGEKGEPGTANVIYSDWITFQGSGWSDPFSFYNQNRRTYTVTEDSITNDIINMGTVMVYVKFSGTSGSIQPLPVIQAITKSENQVLDFYLQEGGIVLVYYNLNNNNDPGTIGGSNQYRYVIIPGGTGLSKKHGHDGYMNLPYKEFCKLFNIPE